MNLPNGDRAIVETEKLRGYCLNSHHPVESGKAMQELRTALLEPPVTTKPRPAF